MRIARAGLILAAGTLLTAGCAGRHVKLGPGDEVARSILEATTITYAKDRALYVARGDGSGERKVLGGEALGPDGVIMFPSLAADGHRMLFLGALDLDVRDSTARGLSLNILAMDGHRFTAWLQIMLDRFVPPRANGRQEVFDVAAAAWSQDGERIALGLNRTPAAGGDALAVFDADGRPIALYSLGDRDLARVSSLCWMAGDRSLLLGLEGDGEAGGTIARLDLPGSGAAATLVSLGAGRYPALEPGDGRLAVIDSRGGRWDMVLMSAEGVELDRYTALAGRAPHRPYWSRAGRYLYYYSLASIGPLGLIEISMLRCLDTHSREIFDLVRLR